jgi:PIN domain nuclease of toxin-antitoxin system
LIPGVLDASAVLAIYFDEPGAEKGRAVVEGSLVSAVNYSEIVAKALDRGDAFDVALRKLARMPFLVMAHDEALARRAGELRTATRRFGLSVGDRACLALAERERLPAYTVDHSWSMLELSIEVVLLR